MGGGEGGDKRETTHTLRTPPPGDSDDANGHTWKARPTSQQRLPSPSRLITTAQGRESHPPIPFFSRRLLPSHPRTSPASSHPLPRRDLPRATLALALTTRLIISTSVIGVLAFAFPGIPSGRPPFTPASRPTPVERAGFLERCESSLDHSPAGSSACDGRRGHSQGSCRFLHLRGRDVLCPSGLSTIQAHRTRGEGHEYGLAKAHEERTSNEGKNQSDTAHGESDQEHESNRRNGLAEIPTPTPTPTRTTKVPSNRDTVWVWSSCIIHIQPRRDPAS